MTPQLASQAFCGMLLLLSLFQVTLIAGAPLGKFAWGGQDRVLPLNLRLGSVASLLIYALMSLLLLSKAGVIDTISPVVAAAGTWAVCLYCLVGIFMNAISRSKLERLTMVPVAALLFVTSLVVAFA